MRRGCRLTRRWLIYAGLLALVATGTAQGAVSGQPGAEPGVAAESAFRAGQFEAALAAWAREAEAARAAGDGAGERRALLGQGDALLALGRYPEGLETLQQALKQADDAGDDALRAAVTASLGNAYLLSGSDEEAAELLRRGASLAREHGRPDVAASAEANLGTVFALRGRWEDAAEAYRAAIAAANASANPTLAAKTRVNLVRALQSGGMSEEAEVERERAFAGVRALPPSHDRAYGLISLARLAVEPEDAPLDRARALEAYAALNEASTTADAIGDARSLSYALGYQGRLYERAQRPDEALELTRQALQAAQRVAAPEIVYRWQWQTGRLLAAGGDREGAINSYRRAIYTLQSIRSDLLTTYQRSSTSFREQVGPLFLELADLELQRAVALDDATEREESLRSVRDTIEVLKGVELSDYFQDDCVAALKSRTVGIDQIAERTAAIYPVVFKDRIEILMSLPDGIKLFTSRVDAAQLEATVRDMRTTLERRITHQYRGPSKQVYDWFIRPIEPELEAQGIETVVIIPDGVLRLIPMAALYDGEKFLVEKYAVATSPGLTLTDPTPIARGEARVLLSGLTESVQGFPPLPNVAQELETIHELYGGTVLKDETFVKDKVADELKGTSYSIVHVATHGQFSRDVNNSYVLTYDGRLNMSQLEQYMGITAVRDKPVELLTLSACQTATGDDRAALGLAGIAVKAGARSALATLWFINDQASAVLIAEFYTQLQNPSLSKAKALQQAQLKLLEDRRYRHPVYWSPFLLIGNWL
ncbi:MAG: CHAT domain-containing protein [Gammaproteobacteria bacterium]|nr:CHAT domain-containing protein [Gammaproteobacteria bacterium]